MRYFSVTLAARTDADGALFPNFHASVLLKYLFSGGIRAAVIIISEKFQKQLRITWSFTK
jgi:hypothetical protein